MKAAASAGAAAAAADLYQGKPISSYSPEKQAMILAKREKDRKKKQKSRLGQGTEKATLEVKMGRDRMDGDSRDVSRYACNRP